MFSRVEVALVLIFAFGPTDCIGDADTLRIQIAVGAVPFVCVGICFIVIICYRHCSHKEPHRSQNRSPETPTVEVIQLPEEIICPHCAGRSAHCPLSNVQPYVRAHPPPAYEEDLPPPYSSLKFDKSPSVQKKSTNHMK